MKSAGGGTRKTSLAAQSNERECMASGGGSTLHAPSRSRAMASIGALVTALLVSALAALAPAAGRADAADPMSIDAAIGRGATQLEGAQLPDGGFGARLPIRDSATAGEALRLARPESPAIAPRSCRSTWRYSPRRRSVSS